LAKEYPYIVVLKNTIRKPAHYISWLLILITLGSGLYFCFTHLTMAAVPVLVLLMAMIVLLIVAIRRTQQNHYPSFFWPIVVASLSWLILPSGFYIGLLVLIAALFERQSHIPVEVGIDAAGITFNHFPVKSYTWNLIQRCLIKDGILTIDYKDNRLYQKEISSDISVEEENEFNSYCAACILQVEENGTKPNN
jgi:hypothetical protein